MFRDNKLVGKSECYSDGNIGHCNVFVFEAIDEALYNSNRNHECLIHEYEASRLTDFFGININE